MKKHKHLIVITGPTASGKSALAIALARRLSTEIVSADSRQIYHGIPVATAMPPSEDLETIPHHLIDMLPLDAYYSASEFEHDALKILDKIWEKKDYALVCGGSMMYVDALCYGIDELPTVATEIREELSAKFDSLGSEWLLNELRRLDPDYYVATDHNNMKRVFHAVEVSLTAGKPYSSLLTGVKAEREFAIHKFALNAPRNVLFERINDRVIKMVESGLVDEAARVAHMRHLNSLNTVGLKEMFAYFDGLLSFDEAVAKIQKNTRVYAKKQLTWFKKDQTVRWLDITECDPLQEILSVIGQKS